MLGDTLEAAKGAMGQLGEGQAEGAAGTKLGDVALCARETRGQETHVPEKGAREEEGAGAAREPPTPQ